jgi:plasmid stabilization system protein ParE
MNFRFSPRAEAEAEKKGAWWRANRPSSAELFDDELGATIDMITKTPTIGAIYSVEVYDVRARQWCPELGAFLSIDEYEYHDETRRFGGGRIVSPIRWAEGTSVGGRECEKSLGLCRIRCKIDTA